MANRITITPEELKGAASNFINKAGEINDILTYLLNEVNNLESTWDGAAQDQFFAKYHELQEPLKQFPVTLEGIAEQLQRIAQTIEETDAQLAQQLGNM